ncbi:MAG: hypothetical protein MN733_43955 [Nitrososphaera sp.]|nr:hypothetical protein [Nitrososphaera sp.]
MMSLDKRRAFAIGVITIGLVMGLTIAPAGFVLRSASAQAVEVSTEEAEDGMLVTIEYTKDQIADFVEEAASDSDDQDIEDKITDVAEEVADDENTREEIQDALDEAINVTDGASRIVMESITIDDVAEAATLETVVNFVAENNSDVLEDAISLISDAMVESITDPEAETGDLVDDAADGITDIIDDGLSQQEVEDILDDLDEDDVIDAIDNEDVDIRNEILLISNTIAVHGAVDETTGTTSTNSSIEQSSIDRLSALENRVAALETSGGGSNLTTFEEELGLGNSTQ